jgi:hypothetical protein
MAMGEWIERSKWGEHWQPLQPVVLQARLEMREASTKQPQQQGAQKK